MNVRKLLDWRKVLLYSHRWMGIAFGLLFVSWFVSGIAFMYWGMPNISAKERLDHQKPVDLSKARLSPKEVAESQNLRVGAFRIEMLGDRPVYRFGRDRAFADTGDLVNPEGVDQEQAVDLIRRWAAEHAATIRYDAYLEDSDQWTLQSAQRNLMPLHRIAVNDDAVTYYYVAEATGEIAMKTTRASRFKGFWSGVLHWVYFTPLRKHTYGWNQFIIWGSFAGALMCLTGLVAGVWRLSIKGRFRQRHLPSHTPYAGLMRWHHYSGLLFGLFSFTWIISGAFSVNPFDMFSSGRGGRGGNRDVIAGGRFKSDEITLVGLRRAVDVMNQQFAPKEIDVQQFRGKIFLTANRPPAPEDPEERSGPTEYQMVWLSNPQQGAFTKFDNAAMEEIAKEAMPGVPVQDKVWLNNYDNYYRSRDGSRPLPVLRVRYLDQQRTWLYLDPHRGTMTQQAWRNRVNRWLYAGLHDLDLPFLYNRRPLWDIVVIVLSLGGITLSSTTLWPMLKRLNRHARRLTTPRRSPQPFRQAPRIKSQGAGR